MAKVTNHPDIRPPGYAQVWSREPFVVLKNDSWPKRDLPAERKGDELRLGVEWKLDIPGPCWLILMSTLPVASAADENVMDDWRVLRVKRADSQHALENIPDAAHLPIYPGVNVIEFEALPTPTPTPEPEPGVPPEPVPPEPTPTPEPEPDPNAPALPHMIVLWQRGSAPLDVRGALSLALEPDLMRPIVTAVVGAVEAQAERDRRL
jgi:hypothetical protein